MKCKQCGETVNLPNYQGRSAVPGYFFIFNTLLIIITLTLFSLSLYILASVSGVILVVGLLANLTCYLDCSIEMGKDGQAKKGITCRSCDHSNTIYPWTF